MARLLGRIRLSRLADESTSPERQKDIIEAFAKANDHTIVGWAIDLNVSGSVDPFDTPEFGDWLNNRADEWDVVAAWKLDRYSRRSIPMNKLFGWCQENGKTLVAVSDNIDLSHWVGRLIASVIAGVAEGELEAIKERTKASAAKLRELGRWKGGHTPYGYVARKREDADGWELVVDPESSKVLLGIIDRVMEGDSLQAIAADLTKRGVLSPTDYRRKLAGKEPLGKPWHRSSTKAMLQSKSLLGYVTYDGSTVRDPEGLPVRHGPELISWEKFEQLQEKLEARSIKRVRTQTTSPLLHVVFCKQCEGPMHCRRFVTDGKSYEYYACGKRCGQQIPKETLETLVEETFLDELGDKPMVEKVYVPGENHQAALNEAIQAMDELTPLLGTATSETAKKRLRAQISALDTRIAELEKLPVTESRYDFVPTGKTYRQEWEYLDWPGRRKMLIKSGIRATAFLTGRVRNAAPGALEFHLQVPGDLVERMSS